MDLREIGGGGMAWIDLAQDRDQWRALVNTVMNLQVPCLEILEQLSTGSFSRRTQIHGVSYLVSQPCGAGRFKITYSQAINCQIKIWPPILPN
jgi:hypothetical protein